MSSRSFRLETRSRARDEIKRIMQTVEKVRKWEKKWIDLGLSNSLKVHKWVPVRDENKDDESDEENKENEPVELTETNLEQSTTGEADLPDIKPSETVPQPMGVDSSSLMASQAPPDMLLGSEEGEKTQSPSGVVAGGSSATPGTATTQDNGETEKDEPVKDETKGLAADEGQPDGTPPECVDEAKPCNTADDTSGEAMDTVTTETETMETETTGDDGGVDESADVTSPVRPAPPTETTAAESNDSESVGIDQTNEMEEPSIMSNEPTESCEKPSACEGDGKAEEGPSESSVAAAEAPSEGANMEASKEERGGVLEKEEDSGAKEETSDKELPVEEVEKRGEKRGCEEAEGDSPPPSPKRSRSQTPQTL